MEYGSLREKIAAESEERKDRYAKFEQAWKMATEAGRKAAEACTPVPMTVVERANPLDDTSPITRRYAPVMDGVCGFAWIVIRPGNSSFARWVKNNRGARKSYYGGIEYPIHDYNQSMAKKEAHAWAMANTLRDMLGVEVYSNSRMD